MPNSGEIAPVAPSDLGNSKLAALVSIVGVVASASFGSSSLAKDFEAGSLEYRSDCAACHGAGGNGNGPIAALLTTRPPALAELSKKNGGVFPFSAVYEAIDGRKTIIAHGTREMPIWGNRFMALVHPSYDAGAMARMRILAIIDYLARIQTNN